MLKICDIDKSEAGTFCGDFSDDYTNESLESLNPEASLRSEGFTIESKAD